MNKFTVVRTLDPKRWDEFVCRHPKGSIFHTRWMMEVYRGTVNYAPSFLAALDPAGEVAALLLSARVQTLPDPLGRLGSRALFYAEPLCREDEVGQQALTVLLREHEAEMRDKTLFAEVRPLHAAGVERTVLERCGYQFEEYLNFLIDLTKPRDELWRAMTNSCRANIRRGLKRGVAIADETTEQGVEILYDLLRASYARAQVPLADKSLFRCGLEVLGPRDMLRVFIARLDDKPIGASVVLLFKQRVYEWYWGVQRMVSVYPAEVVTWHRIEWGQQHGYVLYDFGGAGSPYKPYGVRDFKRKFGGERVNFGRYRKIYSPWRMALAEKGYDIARNLVNPKNWVRH
ncbi:MAG: GNAT family N-acetyltransferase [Chloroflexi bacterium]|nr:GNAT family N-acetyltransferase [Chloroflexota bacterium]